MSVVRAIAQRISAWIDAVAEALLAMQRWFGSSRLLRLIEQADGAFAVEGGGRAVAKLFPGRSLVMKDGRIADPTHSRKPASLRRSEVELLLRSERFIFRALELPRRAADFLDGVVRAQIDRLTPWNAADSAFGWGQPSEIANDRVEVTVAATAKARVAPLIEAVVAEGAEWVSVSALPQPGGKSAAPIRVYERRAHGTLEFRKLRRALILILAAMGLLASAAVATAFVYGGALDERRYDVARRIAQRSAALEIGRGSAETSGMGILEKHKREVPSSVLVIDALSQILPDDTYLAELRVLGDRLQIVGVAGDPPGLIRLIEQSSHFSQATFFAPTTRAPTETREHFSIEAHLEPVYGVGP